MALTLYWDTDTNDVSEALTTNPQTPGVEAKRSENFPLFIFLKKVQTLYRLPDGYYIKTVLKTFNDFFQDPPLASQVTSVYPAEGQPYTLNIDFDTAAIDGVMGVLPTIPCMLEILYSPDASIGSWVPCKTITFTLTNRVSQDDDAASPGAPGMNTLFLGNVTDYIGGDTFDLDYTPTVTLGVPQLVAFVVAGVTQLFQLITGTEATDPVDYTYIRPVDYADPGNTKVWQNVGLVGTGGATFPTTIAHGGTFATTVGGAQTNLQIQPVNAALTSISGLSPAANDFLQYKSGAWANRTVAQVLSDLAGAATTFQPLDATLTAFAGLTIVANSLTVGTGADAFSQVTFAANTFPARASTGDVAAKVITDFALTILDDVNQAAVRTTLALTPGTDVQSQNSRLQIIANNSPASTLNLLNITVQAGFISGSGSGITNLNASNLASGTVPATRGGAGTVTGLMKANGSGSVTAAVPGADYLAPGAGAGISGENQTFILCPIETITPSAITNGNNLRAAYTAAKALTPNGAALGPYNWSAVVLPLSVYDLGTTPLGLDGDYVALVGLTGNPRDVLITSQVTASNSGTVALTASYVHIHGVTIQNTATTRAASNSTDASAYAPASAASDVIVEDCIFDDGGGVSWGMRVGINYSGIFNNCASGDYAFGYNGTFSGVATNCTGGSYCFGTGGTFSGTVYGGTFGSYCFGYNGACSGAVYRANSGVFSFGLGSGTLTGKLYYCKLTGGSFQTVSGGGQTRYCLDGSNTANNQG